MPEDGKVIFKDLSYRIVGSAYTTYNTLGYGHQEKIYERAMAKEFRLAGIRYEQQKAVPLLYHGERIGTYVFDFVVDKKVSR